jgi:Glycosyltransferase family 87
MATGMWFYFQRVLIPYQKADAAAHGRPRGNLSDLYPRWWGAHELLLHGRDPYSEAVTREIQTGYYGRPLNPARPQDPKDEEAFAYPVYVAFLLAPTLHWPFPEVQKGFVVFLWLLTAAGVPLWLQVLRWRPPWTVIASLIILTLGSLPVVQGLKLQQLSLLVAGMLAGCAAALASGYFVLAGVLLALATIKPQLAGLLVLWLLAWTVRDWRRRQRLVWAFGTTMLLLLVGAELVLPGWLWRFLAALENYHRYTHNVSLLGWLLTPIGGDISAAGLLAASAWLCWPFLADGEDSPRFGLALAVVLALTTVVVPMLAPYNQVLLLPALLVAARHAAEIWSQKITMRITLALAVLLMAWSWIASIALTLSAPFLEPARLQSGWKLPLLSSLFVPIFVFAVIALWAVLLRPPAAAAAGLASNVI